MQYLIQIKKHGNGYTAHALDVPGCIAVADSADEAKADIAEAIALHFEGLAADNEAIPQPKSIVDTIDVEMPVTAPIK